MSAPSRQRRAARAIQSQCGVGYQRALQWVRDHDDDIKEMVTEDGSVRWGEFNNAAASHWRSHHQDESE